MNIFVCSFQILVALFILQRLLPPCRFLVASQNTNFTFPNFSSEDQIIRLSDVQHSSSDSSFVLNASQIRRSCGKVMYKDKVRMKDRPVNGTLASFSTSFSFTITCPYSFGNGDGFAFTFTTDNSTLGTPGASMCILDETKNGNSSNEVFAVEFDTFYNPEYGDPSDSHIGVDVNSINSSCAHDFCQYSASGSPCSYFCSNTTSTVFTAWIDYNAAQQIVEVRLANETSATTATRPRKPVVQVRIRDLSTVFGEFMYVGFSASTGDYTEVHKLKSWSFVTSGMPEAALPPSPTGASPAPSPAVLSPAPLLRLTPSSGHADKVGFILSLSGAITAPCLIVVLLIFLYVRRQKRRLVRISQVNSSPIHHLLSRPQLFTYSELKKATKNFSRSELLGTGGFGAVYKGTLQPSGASVAVKRILHESNQGAEEGFVAEASSISQIRHRNLVQLQGWCHDNGHLLLVYEYMPNGSLDQWIFTNRQKQERSLGSCLPREHSNMWLHNGNVLPWILRQKIIAGVAAALAYLHDEWQQCVLHRDIKSSNVLLDADFNARLADFGLARLIDHKKVHKTTLMAGTLGYMAPEMPYTGKATKESDVFSFGILVLEVVCGRRPLDIEAPRPEDLVLVESVRRAYEAGNLLRVADPRLGPLQDIAEPEEEEEEEEDASLDSAFFTREDFSSPMPPGRASSMIARQEAIKIVRFLLHLGLLCCQPDPNARPLMRVINQMIQNADYNALPSIPAFELPGPYNIRQTGNPP